MKFVKILFLFISLVGCSTFKDWKTASRASAQIASLPSELKDAIVHIYAAPVWGVRGTIADHTWIATKKPGASSYKVYQVVGWNKYSGKDALEIKKDVPDRLWFGNKPTILFKLQGAKAEPVVEKIEKLSKKYPYKSNYTMFPGPNSNTFTAWMICKIPELNLELSKRAVGKNYLEDRVKDCQS